jgi:histidinol phosphatase-like PHP family hydrolase
MRHAQKAPPSIGSDAHKPEHFDNVRLEILTARRGWARAGEA